MSKELKRLIMDLAKTALPVVITIVIAFIESRDKDDDNYLRLPFDEKNNL